MRTMRISSVLILLGAFGLILYAGWHRRSPNQMDVAFNSGGKVALDLSAGGYTVRGTTENRVRVEVDPSDARNVQCRINVSGSNAKVELEGPSQNFHATIYVPQRSDLQVDQTIGDLALLDFTPQVGSSHAEQSGDADDDVSDQDSENDSE